MRRPWWSRGCAAFIAVWFTLLAIEPGPLGSCPMHGRAMPGTAGAAAHHAGGAHRGHHDASTSLADHEAGSPAHPDDASHSCTCLGDCAGALGWMALPAQAGAPLAPAVVAERARDGASQLYAAAADHLLPFAIGPPGRA